MKKKLTTFIGCLLFTGFCIAQGFPEAGIKKQLSADIIAMDQGNEDGVFKARHKDTGKWGMYQWMYEGTKTLELIPMQFDSLAYIPFNGSFSEVFNDGLAGIYLAKWSYDDKAKQTVPCQYEEVKRLSAEGVVYLACKKNGKWGWVDWLSGEEKTAFVYDTTDDLPWPDYVQESWY